MRKRWRRKQRKQRQRKRGKYEICHIHQRYVMCLIKFLWYFAALKLGFMCSVSKMCDTISWNIFFSLLQLKKW